MLSSSRLIGLFLSLSLLGGCTVPANSGAPNPTTAVPSPAQSTKPAPQSEVETLPDEIATQVKAQLGAITDATSFQVGRYSRETWSDGCLGLGGPAEACLAALTEGWQVEMIDTATGKRYVYRTNLNGDSIRRSTLDKN